MKKFLVKLLLIVLAVSMIFPLCVALTGCEDDQDKVNDTDTNEPAPEENDGLEDDGETQEGGKKFPILGLLLMLFKQWQNKPDHHPAPDDDEINNPTGTDALSYLPNKNFNNEKFIIICRDEGEEFWREHAEGDKIDYAIYMRNHTIERKYNVDIVPKSMVYYDIPSWVSDILKANDQKSMDIVNNHAIYSSNIVLNGNAIDLQTVPYLDFSNDWWLDSNLNDLTLNGRTYLAVGDMHTSAIASTFCMYYNKDLVREYRIAEDGDMYDLAVTQGKWTYNNMISAIANIRMDLNKDGRYNGNDLYGLVTEGMSYANAYLWSFDNPIFARDEASGELEFTLMKSGTKISKILTNLVNLYGRTDGAFVTPDSSANMFVNGQAIFVNSTFGSGASSLRNMDPEKWGILPYPKYNEKQEKYISAVNGGHNILCIPKTANATKLEKVGIITEALNCLSRVGEGNLVTEYYDRALRSKYLTDPKEAEMADIIMDGRIIDFGYIYLAFESPAFWIQEMVMSYNKDIAGKYRDNRSVLEGAIEDAYAAFGLQFEGLEY